MMPTTPLTAKRMFEALQRHNQELKAKLAVDQFHLLAPFWYLHLPDGDEVKIAGISYEGPLMVFDTFLATSENTDCFLVAPESVVLSVRTADMKSFEGLHAPVEFLPPDSGDTDEDV